MARGCADLEILRRHQSDARQLLPERPFAPHRGPLAGRPYRRDAALLERRRRPAVAARSAALARYGKGTEAGSPNSAGLPFAAAELAAVDDAVARIAGGAELDRAGHRAVADPALEAVGEVARVVAPAKAEADEVAVERAADRPFELGRSLMS